MPLHQVLAAFQASVGQCENLIANAHADGANGQSILPEVDQQQITVSALLNMFIAWETFLESSVIELMTGAPTTCGNLPIRYVSPPTTQAAKSLLKCTRKYFDYGNHQNMIRVTKLLFENGYPFEPHISAIYSDLDDLRTMRNSSVHTSSTTQTALAALANRIFAGPRGTMTLYRLLTAFDPRSATGETVLRTYKNKLTVTAELIARG